MVEIGDWPIIWHIMKIYDAHGVHDFCIALGYKGHIIKEFFVNYRRRINSLRVNLTAEEVSIYDRRHEDWVIDLIETGATALTGARLARLRPYLSKETFLLTYGDGVSDIDIGALIDFHRSSGKIATVTAVRPPARFGAIEIEQDIVTCFTEKPIGGETWVSGGFFVFEPEVFNYLDEKDDCVLEREPLQRLAADGQLAAYRHKGFWQSMDTVRDVDHLNELWRKAPPWKVWRD
jgi:glucose-1-phosphate cytidylyltransferase